MLTDRQTHTDEHYQYIGLNYVCYPTQQH